MGNFYRVSCDKRDLNYDKFFNDGDANLNYLTEFNSSDSQLLNIEQFKEKLMPLVYILNEFENVRNKRLIDNYEDSDV